MERNRAIRSTILNMLRGALLFLSPVVLGWDSRAVESLPTQAEAAAPITSALVFPHYRVIAKEPNQQKIEQIVSSLGRVPDGIQREINNAGGEVVIFDGKLTDIPELSYLSGMTTPGGAEASTYDDLSGLHHWDLAKGARVYVNQERSIFGGWYSVALHEYGHAADSLIRTPIQGRLSSSGEFMNLFYGDVGLLLSVEPAYRKPAEAFANFFNFYYASEKLRAGLRTLFPGAYSYFENLEGRILDGSY